MAGERTAALEELRRFLLSEIEDRRSGESNSLLWILRSRIKDTEVQYLAQHVQNVSEVTKTITELLTEHGSSALWEYVRDWSLTDFYLVFKHLVASAQERALVN